MSSRDAEMLNAIKKLTASIDELNRKTTTPLDIADIVTGYAAGFGMEELENTAEWAPAAALGSHALAFDGEWFYSGDGSNVVEKLKPSGAKTTFLTSAALNAIIGLAWDTDNNYLYAAEEWVDTGKNSRIETYNSSGTLLRSLRTTDESISHTSIGIIGLAYDRDNSKLYALYFVYDSGDNMLAMRYGVLNSVSGKITSPVDVDFDYETNIFGMEYYNGALYLMDIRYSNMGATAIRIHDIGSEGLKTLALLGKSRAGTTPTQYTGMCIDPDRLVWYLTENTLTYLVKAGLTSVQKVSLIDAALPIDDGGGSITIDGTVSITKAASLGDGNTSVTEAVTEIITGSSTRKGLIIQNADTANTAWIGDSSVTTSSGLELLPKQVLALNNYTGATASIYGICSAGLTADVRYIQVF